jgi:hypothetical protein
MKVERLPDFALDDERPLGREFAALGLGSYREAARYVRSLPYGRNTDRSDWRLVLTRIIHESLRRTWKERAIGFALGVPRQDVDGSSSGVP